MGGEEGGMEGVRSYVSGRQQVTQPMFHQQGFATVRIIIDDINDNAPVFSSDSYVGMISEGAVTGSTVQVVS